MELNLKRVIGITLFTVGISSLCGMAYEYTTHMLQRSMWLLIDVYTIIGGLLSAMLGIVMVKMGGTVLIFQIGRTKKQTESSQ